MKNPKITSAGKSNWYFLIFIALMVGVYVLLAKPDAPSIVASEPLATPPLISVEVDRVSSLGEVKNLQYTYAQYAQYGLWEEMASLFSQNAEIIVGNDVISGKDDIRAYIKQFGAGDEGLPVGWLNTEIYMAPVVTLSNDGMSARARWQQLNMRGRMGGPAQWSGGVQVNDYVKEDGTWKFSKVHIHPQFEGPYETGWSAVDEELPFIPYHYTSNQAGAPVPEISGEIDDLVTGEPGSIEILSQAESRIDAMNDGDKVRNLQNIYGYYADRKMWDDVADLFAADGAMEIAGIGIYEGVDSIRRGLERDGPVGLQYGQVHDQIQLHTVVEVDPNGMEARARGMQLGMLTPQLGYAYWMVSTFKNRYVKQDGLWRIREMRIYPKMKADYYQGWHKSVVIDPVPTGNLAPDRESSADHSPQTSAVIPAFFNNPVTGRAVNYPRGYGVVGDNRLVSAPQMTASEDAEGDFEERLADARRNLDVSKAYDAIENISSTFGYYLDDYQWQRYVENYAVDGWRRKGSGNIFIGRAAIFKCEAMSYGPSPTTTRDWIRLHTRVQPVIDINDDADFAYIRTRMFLYFANTRSPGSFNSGMYPNDSAVIEDGVWKMKVGGWIDETYFNSISYALGWARPDEVPHERQQGKGARVESDDPVSQSRRGLSYPPDIPANQLGARGYGLTMELPGYVSWPDIKPMWFHYKNPVSGRVPEFYCPDATQCIYKAFPSP